MSMISYHERRERYYGCIAAGKADLAFLHMGTDLDYLTGLHRDTPNYGRNLHPGGWLEGAWISAKGKTVLSLPRMSAEFGGAEGFDELDVRVLGDWDDPRVMARGILDEMGLPEAPVVAVSDNAEAESLIELQRLLPGVTFVSATHFLRELRVIKSAAEIDTFRKAGQMTEDALDDVVARLKIGMTELDIVTEIDYQLRRHGSLGPSFATTLYVTGPDHPLCMGNPLQTWPRKLTPPASVLLDFGAVHDGMCYDYGRTLCFGEPDAEQLKVHSLIMQSQRAGIEALCAGEYACEDVDKKARDVIAEAGYGEHFRHRLGHGIGWDVHEPPFLTQDDRTVLQEGMIFTIEPSILQDTGSSARVEDCIVVRPGGGEKLSGRYQDLIVVS